MFRTKPTGRPRKPAINLAGMEFGRLTVVSTDQSSPGVYPNGKIRPWKWVCHCECGASISVCGDSLRKGRTKSCGCLRIELHALRKPRLSHGMRRTKEYATWCKIKHRVVHDLSYVTRGITIHPDWIYDFESFYEHIGPAPEKNGSYSVDRIDNDRGYEPGNVRWATSFTQANNKSSNRIILVSGESLTLAQAERKFGVSQFKIRTRLGRGWPPSDAVSKIDHRFRGSERI